jgi:hypothetical protein
MEYRLLGFSGCAVSSLALGALTFGNETSEADSFACPGATWRPPWTRRCGGSASRSSTSTSCTAGIR